MILLSRLIGPVAVDVVMVERHLSKVELTENPVELGAAITDHAYVEPKEVTLEFRTGNPVLTWQALKRFQESRQPFTLVTGLDIYRNMMIKQLSADRDAATGRILAGRCDLKEAIFVSTDYVDGVSDQAPQASAGTASKPASKERARDATTADRASGTVNRGDAPLVDAPTTGTAPEAQANRSLLKEIFD